MGSWPLRSQPVSGYTQARTHHIPWISHATLRGHAILSDYATLRPFLGFASRAAKERTPDFCIQDPFSYQSFCKSGSCFAKPVWLGAICCSHPTQGIPAEAQEQLQSPECSL